MNTELVSLIITVVSTAVALGTLGVGLDWIRNSLVGSSYEQA